MLEQETNPVGVHPPVPDVDVQAADRLPEGGEDWVGQVLRVWNWCCAARLDDEHGQTNPERIRNVVVGRVGGEGVEMDQEDVCLLKMLDGVVELLDNRSSVNAGKLFLLLTNDIVQDLIWTLQSDLYPTFVVVREAGRRPQRQYGVVNESLMFPRQSQSYLHFIVFVGHSVHGVAFT